jgi:endonuclease/exonuclease/phosphatase family metal-dependent hydrolase
MKPLLFFTTLLGLLLGGCSGPKQSAATAVTFRVMTFNIHHGRGLDDQVNLERIAALIQSEQADVVALQEVDKGVARTARRDLPAELAALTGLTAVFSNNFHFQGGEYGNAILTKFPVTQWQNRHYQMLRVGEQRGLLQATLNIRGREVLLLNTHIDYRGDDAERWMNVAEIETVARQHPNQPIILCGDFNDTPGSRVHRRLSETFFDVWELAGAGPGFTFPAAEPTKRIDFIWLSRSPGMKARRAWVPQTDASDHLPVVAEFQWEPNSVK